MRDYVKDKILEVTWVDIVQDPNWLDEDKIDKEECPLCSTVGFFYKQTKEYFYLSSTISGSQRDVTIIPTGCIKKIRSLR